jgi:protein-S-isoprenylcysteine O-methyltransferase Ste14
MATDVRPAPAGLSPSSALYELGARGAPAAILAVLAGAQISGLSGATTFAEGAHHALSAILWGLFAVLVCIRPTPLRRGGSLLGVAAAVGAQGSMVALGAFTTDAAAGGALLVGNVVLLAGIVFTIVSVAVLGRCFGILPDVRGLVTRGPYRLVRHPVYLGEQVAALGLLIGSENRLPTSIAFVAVLVCQLVRTRYEEAGLTAQFPEYAAYAQRTKRLIPGVV